MRMGQHGPTAADVIARASEADLANIIYIFGEERHSRGVARAIVAARKEAPIVTTRALADIVAKVVWSKPGDIHPATRTFQALADLRQRGARRTASGAVGGGAGAEARRPARGGLVPFAGRPHRQEFPRPSAARSGGGSRHLPERRAGRAELRSPDQAPDHGRRRGDRRQSARALGQAARRRAHRGAGACGRRTCRHGRRLPT